MTKPSLYLLCCLVLLVLCCAFPGQEQEEQKKKIEDLEQRNQQLHEEKTNLTGQNKRLKTLADKILQRLERYARIEKRLIDENSELYRKLYDERLSEQVKLDKERAKDLKELEEEASKIMENSRQGTQDVMGVLGKYREELLALSAWEKNDEIRFVEITEKLMRQQAPPEEEEETQRQALQFRDELEQRLAKMKAAEKSA